MQKMILIQSQTVPMKKYGNDVGAAIKSIPLHFQNNHKTVVKASVASPLNTLAKKLCPSVLHHKILMGCS